MAQDPTEFVRKDAERIVRLIRENPDDATAIEILTLHLKLTYHQGFVNAIKQARSN